MTNLLLFFLITLVWIVGDVICDMRKEIRNTNRLLKEMMSEDTPIIVTYKTK